MEELYGLEKTESLMATILAHADVIPVNQEIAIMAGSIKSRQKQRGSGMGAVDCMILATARVHGLKIVSGDKHFAGLDECLEIPVT